MVAETEAALRVLDVFAWMEGKKAGSDLSRNRRRNCLRCRSFRAPSRCGWPGYRNQGNGHRIVHKALQGL